MALTPAQEAEYARLARRALKAGVAPAPAKPTSSEDAKALREVAAAILKLAESKTEAPAPKAEPTERKKWKFSHKYDMHGRVMETHAEQV